MHLQSVTSLVERMQIRSAEDKQVETLLVVGSWTHAMSNSKAYSVHNVQLATFYIHLTH